MNDDYRDQKEMSFYDQIFNDQIKEEQGSSISNGENFKLQEDDDERPAKLGMNYQTLDHTNTNQIKLDQQDAKHVGETIAALRNSS